MKPEKKGLGYGYMANLEERVVSQQVLGTAKLLKEGVIAAVGNKSMIGYPIATLCNYLMAPINHKQLEKY